MEVINTDEEDNAVVNLLRQTGQQRGQEVGGMIMKDDVH